MRVHHQILLAAALCNCCLASRLSQGLRKGIVQDHFPGGNVQRSASLNAATEAFQAWMDTRPPVRLGDEIHFGDNFFECKDITEQVPIEEEYPVCARQRLCSAESSEVCQAGCFVNVTTAATEGRYLLLEATKGEDPVFLGEGQSQCKAATILVEEHCTKRDNATMAEEFCLLVSKLEPDVVVCRECNRSCSLARTCKTVKKCRPGKRLVGIEDRVVRRVCKKFLT